MQLGAGEVGTPLPAVFGYWRDFGARYITAMCAAPALAERSEAALEAPPPVAPSLLGPGALLDFNMELTLDGERLGAAEIKKLLAGSDGLQLIREHWVEVDRQKLGRMLDQFRNIERVAAAGGLPFAEAMRLVAGASVSTNAAASAPKRRRRPV